MAINVGVVACSDGQGNFGTKGCKLDPKSIIKDFFLERGTTFNIISDNLDQDKVDELVRKKKLTVMPSHISTVEAEATVYKTNTNGEKSKSRNGIFDKLSKYENQGHCFSNKITSLEKKSYDWIFLDSSGVLWVAKTVDNTSVKGMQTNFVGLDTKGINNDADPSYVDVRISLTTLGSLEYYERLFPIENSSVDWGALDGINDVNLVIEGAPTGTEVKFKALIGCDQTTPALGLGPFARATATDGTITQGTATETQGVITFVPATALAPGDYVLDLFDTAENSAVLKDSENTYYEAGKVSFTVA